MALVQQDAREPGLKILLLPELAQVPEGLIDRLVHGFQGVGLPAQVQIRRPVELVSPCAHPEREFLPIHAIASFHLLEFPAGDFHCGRGKIFKMQEKSRSPGGSCFLITLWGGPCGRRPSGCSSPHGCRPGWRRCPRDPASPGWSEGPRRFPADGRRRSGAGCGG